MHGDEGKLEKAQPAKNQNNMDTKFTAVVDRAGFELNSDCVKSPIVHLPLSLKLSFRATEEP